jgi:hypothetical protein
VLAAIEEKTAVTQGRVGVLCGNSAVALEVRKKWEAEHSRKIVGNGTGKRVRRRSGIRNGRLRLASAVDEEIAIIRLLDPAHRSLAGYTLRVLASSTRGDDWYILGRAMVSHCGEYEMAGWFWRLKTLCEKFHKLLASVELAGFSDNPLA